MFLRIFEAANRGDLVSLDDVKKMILNGREKVLI